ncbi:MAG: DMT family transporter [Desulfobacca sp.]|uniref:DMT family transporter n=1 Tax=Desulfobacca sp. TaxID=2067990 RepID=UPI00404B8CD5
MKVLLLFMLLAAGAMASCQPLINARLAQKVGLVESSLISFLVGTIFLLVMTLFFGRGSLANITQASWWQLTGGLMGAFFVFTVILVVPQMGTGTVMAATIAAQLLAALILDHFQVFGFRHIPIDLPRLIGAVLMLAGTWLIIRT